MPRAIMVSPLAAALAEADFLDDIAALYGADSIEERLTHREWLASKLERAKDSCFHLDALRLDVSYSDESPYASVNEFLREQLKDDLLGWEARSLAAAIKHLCPEHTDLLG